MPDAPTPRPSKTLTVRLPIELYQQIAELAQKERRSLNKQLLVLLAQRLPAPPRQRQAAVPPASRHPDGQPPIAVAYALGGADAVTGD